MIRTALHWAPIQLECDPGLCFAPGDSTTNLNEPCGDVHSTRCEKTWHMLIFSCATAYKRRSDLDCLGRRSYRNRTFCNLTSERIGYPHQLSLAAECGLSPRHSDG